MKQIGDVARHLSEEEQKRVLELMKSLGTTHSQGVPGKSLLRFEATIDKGDLELMEQAIKQDCERVSSDGW